MPVHRTLPIPQVDPPATERSDTEPGIGPVPRPSKQVSKMARKSALRTPFFPRPQSQRGIDSGMTTMGSNDPSMLPTIPLPVRSSLAQTILVHRVQLSHYFAKVAGATRYNGGMAPGYPVAKVLSLINTAPLMRRNARAVTGLRGLPARSGYMSAPPRFTKALPLPVNDYQPPIYGE